MKKLLVTGLSALVLTSFSACGEVKEEPKTENTETTETAEVAVVEEKLPGKDFLMAFQSVNVTAKAGDTVLAPSKAFLERFYKNEAETMILYNQTMVTPSAKESTLNNFSDNDYQMPNSFIVSIPADQTAKPGDFILTWWQSGSGMKIAYVVEGGTEAAPMVKYMDLGLDKEPEQIMPNTFYKLTGEKLAGTPVIVKVDGRNNREIYLTEVNGKVLTQGWASRLFARDASSVKAVDLYAEYNVGDSVFADKMGSYDLAQITKIDKTTGKISATVKGKEEEFDMTEISKTL